MIIGRSTCILDFLAIVAAGMRLDAHRLKLPLHNRLVDFEIQTLFFLTEIPNGSPKRKPSEETGKQDMLKNAETSLNKGDFRNSEPGPYRIFAVYALE